MGEYIYIFFAVNKMSRIIQNFNLSDLIVNSSSQRLEYRRRRDEDKKSLHLGQRKLLMSEIEFLTIYWDPIAIPRPICVYAGAAPGTHIKILSMLFPAVTFHLYDPREFEIQETEMIKIYQEYFTDEVASRYSDRGDVFFVSDIRTANHKEMDEKKLIEYGIKKDKKGKPIGSASVIRAILDESRIENEDQIWGDMSMQQNWVLIMNPEHALLKLRFPYSLDGKDKILKYLKGTVYWQMWAPQTSTETRLKPEKNSMGKYELGDWSILEYEQLCFYHNVVEREQIDYLNPFTGRKTRVDDDELLNDYDSVGEAFVLKLYYEKFGSENLYNDVVNLSRKITGRGRSLSNMRRNAKNKRIPVRSAYQHTKIMMNPTWRDK